MNGQTTALRAGALLGAVVVPYAVGQAEMTHRYHRTLSGLTQYSPYRFVHGAIWTLPLSGLVVSRPTRVGTKLGVLIVVGAIYLLWAGPGRAVVRFAAAHVIPTLLALTAILVAGALASPAGHQLYRMSDTGISAGLAGTAGALIVLAWRRHLHAFALVVAVGLGALFGYGLLTENLPGVLADVEHLLAMGVGALVELRWPVPPPAPTVEPASGIGAIAVAGAPGAAR